MADHYAEYTFRPIFSGNTFDGLIMEMELNEAPLDLTGYRIIMHMKRRMDKNSPIVFSFDTVDGDRDAAITILDAAAGRFRFESCIMDIEPFKYVCDILFIHGETVKTRVVSTWEILRNVTKQP